MELSVVVSTLNDRERLLPCLDALAARTPAETELVVVNGPSSDGTTGAVREREDVDVLVEISERNPNVSRNAGIEAASGDVVALLGDEYEVTDSWYDAVATAVANGADVVTGPTAGRTEPESATAKHATTVAGRSVTHFDGENVAVDRTVLETLDGFDEYLTVGGAVDCAHRVAALGFDVVWNGEMTARSEFGTDGGRADPNWGARYRSLGYRLAKNYGPRPTVLGRTLGSALRDGYVGTRAVASGEAAPTTWFGDGVDALTNVAGGLKDGIRARWADRSTRRNPHGLSARRDRAVRLYDRREDREPGDEATPDA